MIDSVGSSRLGGRKSKASCLTLPCPLHSILSRNQVSSVHGRAVEILQNLHARLGRLVVVRNALEDLDRAGDVRSGGGEGGFGGEVVVFGAAPVRCAAVYARSRALAVFLE